MSHGEALFLWSLCWQYFTQAYLTTKGMYLMNNIELSNHPKICRPLDDISGATVSESVARLHCAQCTRNICAHA